MKHLRAIIVAILLVAAVVVLLLWPGKKKKPIRTFYYLPDESYAREVTQEIQAIAGHAPYITEYGLLRDYQRLCMSEFASPDAPQDPGLREQVMESASMFAALNGIYAFMAAGYRECEIFISALQKCMAEASKSGMPVVRYVYSHVGAQWVRDLAKSSGDFLNFAVLKGLVTQDMTQGDLFVARMIFLYRWIGLLGLTPGAASSYLPEQSLRTVWGWLVERSRDVPYIKRAATLRLLETYVPDYPSAEMRLLLLLKRGQIQQAYQVWLYQKRL